MTTDPFASLDPDWAKAAERRAVRAARLHRLRGALRRRPRGPRGPRRKGPWAVALFVAAVIGIAFAAPAIGRLLH